MTPVPAQETDDAVWTIRVCECGFPLGAVLAVLALRDGACPDCRRAVWPVENRTRSVNVQEVRR